jgi:hypothetical protein
VGPCCRGCARAARPGQGGVGPGAPGRGSEPRAAAPSAASHVPRGGASSDHVWVRRPAGPGPTSNPSSAMAAGPRRGGSAPWPKRTPVPRDTGRGAPHVAGAPRLPLPPLPGKARAGVACLGVGCRRHAHRAAARHQPRAPAARAFRREAPAWGAARRPSWPAPAPPAVKSIPTPVPTIPTRYTRPKPASQHASSAPVRRRAEPFLAPWAQPRPPAGACGCWWRSSRSLPPAGRPCTCGRARSTWERPGEPAPPCPAVSGRRNRTGAPLPSPGTPPRGRPLVAPAAGEAPPAASPRQLQPVCPAPAVVMGGDVQRQALGPALRAAAVPPAARARCGGPRWAREPVTLRAAPLPRCAVRRGRAARGAGSAPPRPASPAPQARPRRRSASCCSGSRPRVPCGARQCLRARGSCSRRAASRTRPQRPATAWWVAGHVAGEGVRQRRGPCAGGVSRRPQGEQQQHARARAHTDSLLPSPKPADGVCTKAEGRA